MKTIIILPLILALILGAFSAKANDKYYEVMQKNIQQLYEAASVDEIQNTINAFERIGSAEKDKWEPYYYATFGYIMMASREKEASKKDLYLDKANEVLKRATSLNSSDSELITLEGFIYTIRVTVDPASRGQQYSGLAMQTFGKALGIDPENPRALSLMAQMEFGTAQFFGSSTDGACQKASAALNKFESYKSDNILAPRWGKEMCMSMVKNCTTSK